MKSMTPVSAFTAKAHQITGKSAVRSARFRPRARPSSCRSMTTLAPTTMPRPMEWRVRMVGYAQMEGDSRTQVPSPLASIQVRSSDTRRMLAGRLLFFHHAAAGDNRAAVEVRDAGAAHAVRAVSARWLSLGLDVGA